MSDQFQNQLDIDLMDATLNDTWVPFSVRYGLQKISDWLKPNPNYPKPEGFLWAAPQEGNTTNE